MLLVDGKRCLIVGGGRIAQRKALRLLESGARVHIVSPTLTGTLITRMERDSALTYEKRGFMSADLKGKFLVIAATDDRELNGKICVLALEKGILCNSVNTRDNTDFMNMAEIRFDGLTIAASSGGKNVKKAKAWIADLKRIRKNEKSRDNLVQS
jgi:siroheme synthase-like protein